MRMIDADALSAKVCFNDCPHCHGKCPEVDLMDVQCWIEDAPTVDPFEHGYWIDVRGNGKKCSRCGRRVRWQGENYCPKCGAKMDEKAGE